MRAVDRHEFQQVAGSRRREIICRCVEVKVECGSERLKVGCVGDGQDFLACLITPV